MTNSEQANKKVALVTGASRGIGRAIAKRLGASGLHVVVGYGGYEAGAQSTVAAIVEAGGSAECQHFDLQNLEASAQSMKELLEKHANLQVLVNNAAIALDGLLLRLKDEDWERQLTVNLSAPMALCRGAARVMMRQRSGSIVNVVSVVGEMGNAGQSAYSASKAGLIGFSKSLARELAPRNIRVNAVSPGFIDTEMTQGLPEAARERILSQIPLSRLGKPEEVASLVAFLASDEASYITGEVIRVNGGLLI